MLSFFVRLSIIVIALMICVGFSSAILSVPLILPVVFVCSWIFSRSLKEVIWEIIAFIFIYDFLLSDRVGLYFVIIFAFALFFNFVNYSVFEVSGERVVLAYASVSFLAIVLIVSNFFFSTNEITFIFLLKQIFSYILISIFSFFIFIKLIGFLERFIFSYTKKINVKRHI